MDSHQPTPPPINYTPPAPNPGLFGTGIPSSVSFIVGILLFFLPFTEIKCGGTALMTKSGLGYALGQQWKVAGGFGRDMMKDMPSKDDDMKEGNARIFILAAAGLGLIGLLSTFIKSKSGSGIGIFSGILAAGALIAFMIEVKKLFNAGLAKQAAEKAGNAGESTGFDKLGDTLNSLAFGFTPWFYVTIVAFLAAAFFCFKRMSSFRS